MQALAMGQGVVVTYYPSGPLFEYAPERVKSPPGTAEDLLAWIDLRQAGLAPEVVVAQLAQFAPEEAADVFASLLSLAGGAGANSRVGQGDPGRWVNFGFESPLKQAQSLILLALAA